MYSLPSDEAPEKKKPPIRRHVKIALILILVVIAIIIVMLWIVIQIGNGPGYIYSNVVRYL